MSKAIEQIVDAYVKLGNRVALENLRMHRRMLAVDLKGRAGYDQANLRLDCRPDNPQAPAALRIPTGELLRDSR